MKVRCIKADWKIYGKKSFWTGKSKLLPSFGPKKGDVVTIEREKWIKGRLFYHLIEWPDDNAVYLSTHFEPIEQQYQSVSFEKIQEKASAN